MPALATSWKRLVNVVPFPRNAIWVPADAAAGGPNGPPFVPSLMTPVSVPWPQPVIVVPAALPATSGVSNDPLLTGMVAACATAATPPNDANTAETIPTLAD